LRRSLKKYLLLLIVLIGVSQMIPIQRSNPPVTAEIIVPADVMTLLRRACYDCHSNETTWPWYSRIAPISWLMAYDVSEGRHHLNFSRWGDLPPDRQAKKLQKTAEAIAEGEMPPFYYLPAHPQARLSDREKVFLRNWARQGNQSSHD